MVGAFAFAQLYATASTLPDWIVVKDNDTGETHFIDDNSPCFTIIVVEEDGSFETDFAGDCYFFLINNIMKNVLILALVLVCSFFSSFTNHVDTSLPNSDWILIQDVGTNAGFTLIDDGVRGCVEIIIIEDDGTYTSEFVGDC